uniref:Uncharacterized protein n=1 Tax=Cacopsylla melanoneura TaxID=428564 RepID=A0A8D8WW60_9HEMI
MAHEFAIASLRAKKARTDRTDCHRMTNNLLKGLLSMCKTKTTDITESVESVQISTENQEIGESPIETVDEIPIILVNKSSQTYPNPSDIETTVKHEASTATSDQKLSTESIQKKTEEDWRQLIDKVRKQITENMREVCVEKPYCLGHSESATSVYQKNRLHYERFKKERCVRKWKCCFQRDSNLCGHKRNCSKDRNKSKRNCCRDRSKLNCFKTKSCVDKSQKPSNLSSSDKIIPNAQSLLLRPVECWCCSQREKPDGEK